MRDNIKMSKKISILLEEVSYNKATRRLKLKIIQKTTTPRISRYVQSNYVRTPVYEDYSIRTKVLKKIDKLIDPIIFTEKELHSYKWPEKINDSIIHVIGNNPSWRKIQILESKHQKSMKYLEGKRRGYQKEKKAYKFKITTLPEKQGNFYLRLFLFVFCFGLSFIGYISKNKAVINKKENDKNKNYNRKHKKKINLKNAVLKKEIINFNNDIDSNKRDESAKLAIKISSVKSTLEVAVNEWHNIREIIKNPNDCIKEKKGCYIIWNKTKDKHYIGQTKNLYKRLFTQHFIHGDVNNIKFAKDYYNGDDFYLKIIILNTKDELDKKEKELIGIHNSFKEGYNKTNGNT